MQLTPQQAEALLPDPMGKADKPMTQRIYEDIQHRLEWWRRMTKPIQGAHKMNTEPAMPVLQVEVMPARASEHEVMRAYYAIETEFWAVYTRESLNGKLGRAKWVADFDQEQEAVDDGQRLAAMLRVPLVILGY